MSPLQLFLLNTVYKRKSLRFKLHLQQAILTTFCNQKLYFAEFITCAGEAADQYNLIEDTLSKTG